MHCVQCWKHLEAIPVISTVRFCARRHQSTCKLMAGYKIMLKLSETASYRRKDRMSLDHVEDPRRHDGRLGNDGVERPTSSPPEKAAFTEVVIRL